VKPLNTDLGLLGRVEYDLQDVFFMWGGINMSEQVDVGVIHGALKRLMHEAFEHEHGIFLDRGTTLLETLEIVSAEEACKPVSQHGTSIAAHANHVKFYLNELIHAAEHGPRDIDWESSWELTEVDETEWVKLRADLHGNYAKVLDIMMNLNAEQVAMYLNGALGVIAHTAYHIGAIRQILNVVRA